MKQIELPVKKQKEKIDIPEIVRDFEADRVNQSSNMFLWTSIGAPVNCIAVKVLPVKRT